MSPLCHLGQSVLTSESLWRGEGHQLSCYLCHAEITVSEHNEECHSYCQQQDGESATSIIERHESPFLNHSLVFTFTKAEILIF